MDIRWIIFVLLWGILVYKLAPKLNTSLDVEQNEILKRINKVLMIIDDSRQKNMRIFNVIDNYFKKEKSQSKFIEEIEYQLDQLEYDLHYFDSFYIDLQPSSEYEQFRRRVRQNTLEMWNYFSSELGKVSNDLGFINNINEQIRNVFELGAVYKRSIISNIDQMRSVDGYEMWRQKEAENLSYLVQKRLSYLQNPMDCKNTKKILCDFSKQCDFGCLLHHIVYCFIFAYATERMLVLSSTGWRYSTSLKQIFPQLFNTCTEYNIYQTKEWPASPNIEIIKLPSIDKIVPRPSCLPLAIPEDLANQLMKLHGNPIVWWIGQIFKFFFVPKYGKQKAKMKLGWKKPIVGVHVRRTDKIGKEAEFYSIEKYMTYVEDYYLTLEMSNTKVERRVFLATDDPNVIKEARTKYPQYTILGDVNVAQTANISMRFSISSLYGIISDIHMLSLSDYLICTFSSNVCRTAYEIMQNYYPDASDRFKSLDFVYHFVYQNNHSFQVILSHSPRNKEEIILKPGALIPADGFYYLFWKNSNRLHNTRFPLFKVKDVIETFKLPSYRNVNLFY